MDLGSGSSVSKKDAKLGFVVNYTNLLLIPEPWYVPDNLTSGARVLGSDVVAVGIDPL